MTGLDQLQQKLERCSSLPTLPSVAIRIVQMCQRDDIDINELVQVIARDPALSVKLLKMANSSAFGARRGIRTLSHAVMLIGTRTIPALALSFSLVPGAGSRKQKVLDRMWEQVVAAATASRELAREVRYAAPEEAFLCGLLQNVGMLALMQIGGKDYQELLERAGDDHNALAALELEIYGADHGQVGEWLLSRWKLPPSICKAIGLSHRSVPLLPGVALTADAMLCELTAVSAITADIFLRESVSDATVRARDRLLPLLDGSEERFRLVLARIAEAMPEVGRLFEVDLGAEADANAVLEEAKEALLMLSMRTSQEVDQARETILQLADQTQKLSEKADRDALTGLFNRGRIDRYLHDQVGAQRASGAPLSILMGDIDHFKVVNDTCGHNAGDAVLKAVADVFGGGLRAGDLAGRYGGEEFMLVLPGTGSLGAQVVGENIRREVEGLRVPYGKGADLRVTISLGCATLVGGKYASPEELVRAADMALYAAKRAGRNAVIPAEAPSPAAKAR